jgi:multicomponent Na+:H+ antiporter subunit E
MQYGKEFFARLLNYLKIFVAIFIFWFLLSWNLHYFFIICGIISTVITFFLCYKMHVLSNDSHFFKLNFFIYIYALLKDIIKSAVNVVKLVFSESIKIDPAIKVINVSKLNRQEKVLFANLITMTPGTFVIAIDGDEFLIHAIDKKNLEFTNNNKIAKLLYKMR